MATVELRHVWKKYGEVEAVRDLSLTCRDGEFLCLLGPSGCGKSSTMRMVAGLEKISDGDLLMDGRRVNDVPARDRDIAMVFENYALYPHLNVRDNIAMPLRRLPHAEIERRVREVAEILSIVPLLPRRIANLSGGQKQRVGIGRAIVREPRLFIMDEPISHLEARLRADMRTELKRLHHRLGVTTLYVTHDQLEAVALADQIAVMNLGELQQVGSPSELFDFPANEFVASFIGSPPMNMLAFRRASREGGDLLLEGSGGPVRVRLPAERLAALPRDGAPKLGIRPVDIELRPPAADVTMLGKVVLRQRLGDYDRFLVECGRERLLVQAPTETAGAAGDAIGLFFPPSRVHLFDNASGKTLSTAGKADRRPPAGRQPGDSARG
jgi:multiple sugar transport system ATP-binding protein